MKSIKTSMSSRLVALLAGATLFGLASQSALALTAAGSTINNVSTLQYSVGAVAQNSINSSPTGNTVANTITGIPAGVGNGTYTSFLVDYKVNLLVAGSGALVNVTPGTAAATPGAATAAVTVFTVTNLSNTTQDFALTAADAAIGTAFVAPATSNDAFDSTGLTIYVGATLATATATTKITALAAGASTNVYVASAIPLTATNGQQSMISLLAQAIWPAALPAWAPTATANGNTAAVAGAAIVATTAGTPNNAGTTVDIVFADGQGVIDAATPDGKYSAYNAYNITSSALSVAKVVTLLCDPVNGSTNPKNIPGAVVQYAITITNAAAASSATLTQVTDALAASLAADTKLISGVSTPANAATNCVGGFAGTSLSASGFGAVSGAGVVTSYAAPGLATQATTAGATATGGAGGTVTINYGTLVSPAYSLVGGVLPASSFVTVYFNAVVQ